MIALMLVTVPIIAQEKESEPMPKLEIPEITIVGKKPITLPFARKGELYDVPLYTAPEPDSSLLGDSPPVSLPLGVLPRLQRRHSPFHAAFGGGFGSYKTGNAEGHIDYLTSGWGASGMFGYRSTGGHVGNASASSLTLGARGHTQVITDNDLLGSFRMTGGISVANSEYGMFGIPSPLIRRRMNNVVLETQLSSSQRSANVFDAHLKGNFWSVEDSYPSADSQASGGSPYLRASFTTGIHRVRLSSSLMFTSASLNFSRPLESPTLFGLSVDVGWRIGEDLFVQVGGIYASGSHSGGGSQTLLMPTLSFQYSLDHSQGVSWWWKPEMRLTGYEEHLQHIPYMNREVDLRAEKIPISLGGSYWMKKGMFDLEARVTYAEHLERGIPVSDSSDRIHLAHIYATQLAAELTGSFYPATHTGIRFGGKIQPTYEKGRTAQVPMEPLIRLHAKSEIDLSIPLVLSSSIEYISRRAVDLAGTDYLNDVMLVGAGISTNVIPRTIISLDISNIVNIKYEWWRGYTAPGRQVVLQAKISLQ